MLIPEKHGIHHTEAVLVYYILLFNKNGFDLKRLEFQFNGLSVDGIEPFFYVFEHIGLIELFA